MRGATAPDLGNRRGCACAFGAVLSRRAETAFRPPPHGCARPPASPGGLGRLLRSMGKLGKVVASDEWAVLVLVASRQSRGLPKIFQAAGGGFPIWCVVAEPQGRDADAGGLHPCGGGKAPGPRQRGGAAASLPWRGSAPSPRNPVNPENPVKKPGLSRPYPKKLVDNLPGIWHMSASTISSASPATTVHIGKPPTNRKDTTMKTTSPATAFALVLALPAAALDLYVATAWTQPYRRTT